MIFVIALAYHCSFVDFDCFIVLICKSLWIKASAKCKCSYQHSEKKSMKVFIFWVFL